MPFYTYILYSPGSGHYYIGHTEDLDVRMAMHNGGNPNSYTSRYKPWILVASLSFETRSQAMRAEAYLKKKPRSFLDRIAEDPELMEYITNRFGVD